MEPHDPVEPASIEQRVGETSEFEVEDGDELAVVHQQVGRDEITMDEAGGSSSME
jgi:DNA-binding IclR family transcriptional regulator